MFHIGQGSGKDAGGERGLRTGALDGDESKVMVRLGLVGRHVARVDHGRGVLVRPGGPCAPLLAALPAP